MEKNAIIKSLRINYMVSFVAALAVMLAFESGFIEKGALVKVLSSTAIYVIEVVTVLLTIAFILLAVKGFTSSLEKAKGLSEADFIKMFCKKSLQRIFLLFVVIVVSEFSYYGLGYDAALYCGLMGLGSMIYSFPTRMVLEQFLAKGEE